MLNCAEAASLLLKNDNYILVTHKNPDGDTLCSAAALCRALQRAGKTAYLFPNPEVTEKFRPFVAACFAPEAFAPEHTVAVDVAARDMFCRSFDADSSIWMVIDHHPTNSGFAQVNCVEPGRSACGEIVTEIIEEMPGSITGEEANLLYIALATDTGCFMYANTNAGTFQTASRLAEYGASMYDLNAIFFRKVSNARLALEGMILSGMEYFRNGSILVSTVTRDMMRRSGATENDTDDLAAIPGRSITEKLGVTIRETEEGSCKISLRSVPEINSAEICEKFGGGGHLMAAGCTIHAGPEEAKKQILEAIYEWLSLNR